MMNSRTDSATASTMATPMTTLSMLFPSLALSHFSNRLGSSSSTPSIFVDASSEDMPMTSMFTMLTTPRTMGQPIHLCRLAGFTYASRLRTISPSGLRTAMAMASGAFIMTPSMTACPPISTRFSFLGIWGTCLSSVGKCIAWLCYIVYTVSAME